jgi:hypothetical protein
MRFPGFISGPDVLFMMFPSPRSASVSRAIRCRFSRSVQRRVAFGLVHLKRWAFGCRGGGGGEGFRTEVCLEFNLMFVS